MLQGSIEESNSDEETTVTTRVYRRRVILKVCQCWCVDSSWQCAVCILRSVTTDRCKLGLAKKDGVTVCHRAGFHPTVKPERKSYSKYTILYLLIRSPFFIIAVIVLT